LKIKIRVETYRKFVPEINFFFISKSVFATCFVWQGWWRQLHRGCTFCLLIFFYHACMRDVI